MPRSDIKYEITRDDPDSMDYYLQHVQEYQTTSKIQKSFWNMFGRSLVLIAIYFPLSVGLTFYQQWLLHDYVSSPGKKGFQYPLGTVVCHLLVKFFLSACVRSVITCKRGHQQTRLSWQSIVTALAPPGIASGLDVGFSNWALLLTNISLYTMTKSTTIIFILGFSLIFKLERKSWSLVGVVSMISTGLIMFTYKSPQFQVLGFLFGLMASFSSGLRWTMAQLIMQKSKLGLSSPIDMMYYMQPWMLFAVAPLAWWFEGERIAADFRSIDWIEPQHALTTASAVLAGAILAFSMEVMEFMVVTYSSSLTLSISGVVKEICMVVLAIEWKGDQINGLNFFGFLLCLGGIVLHVTQKVLWNKKEMVENLELHSNSITTNGSTVDDDDDDDNDTNVPLLTERSTSLTNLLASNFSTDDEDDDYYVSRHSFSPHNGKGIFPILPKAKILPHCSKNQIQTKLITSKVHLY